MRSKQYGLLLSLLLLMPVVFVNNMALTSAGKTSVANTVTRETIMPFKPVPSTLLKEKISASVSEPEIISRQPYTGLPSTWWDTQFEYRINVTVTEPGVTGMDDWFVDVFVRFDPPAYKYSIRVVQVTDTGFVELSYQLWNVTTINDDYIASATITIPVKITRGGTNLYQIYWSTEVRDPPSLTKRVAVYEESGAEGVTYTVRSIDYGWSIELPPTNGGRPSNITLPTGDKIGADWLHFGVTRGVSTAYGGYWGTGNTNYEPEARYIAEFENTIEQYYAGVLFVTYKIVNAPLKSGDWTLAYVNYTYRIFYWGIIVEENIKWVADELTSTDYYVAGWVFDQDDADVETFNAVLTDSGLYKFPPAYNPVSASISNYWSLYRMYDPDYNLPLARVFRVYLTAGSHTVKVDNYPDGNDMEILVYNPSGSYITSARTYWDYVSVSFTADVDGYYYIVVKPWDEPEQTPYDTITYDVFVDGNIIAHQTNRMYRTTDYNLNPYAVALIDFVPKPELVNKAHKLRISWEPISNDLDVIVYDEDGNVLAYNLTDANPLTIEFTPQSVGHYTILIHQYSGTNALVKVEVLYPQGPESIDDTASNSSWTYVAFIHTEENRGIGLIHLSQQIQGTISLSANTLMWYNEGDDSEEDYIYFARYIAGLQASRDSRLKATYAIVPWLLSGTTTDEKVEPFLNTTAKLSSTLSVSLGDYESFYLTVTLSVTDGDGLPIAGATVEFYNSTNGLAYTGTTDGNGVLVIDVLRDNYTICVKVSSGNYTFVNSTTLLAYGLPYTIHHRSLSVTFSNLVKVSLRALTNTTDPMPIQNGRFLFNASNLRIAAYTNYTGWVTVYLTKELWTISFNATAPTTPDTEDTIYVFTSETLDESTRIAGPTKSFEIDFSTSNLRTFWIKDDDITEAPIPTQLTLWDTPSYIEEFWGETVEIKVNLTRTDTNEPINGTLYWYIYDSDGYLVLNSSEAPVANGTFTFTVDLGLLKGGETYTILINATPVIPGTSRAILYPTPITVALDVLNRPMYAKVSYTPSDLTIYWGEQLIVNVKLYDYLTDEPVNNATVKVTIHHSEGQIEVTVAPKSAGEYEAYLGDYLKALSPGTYIMMVHIQRDNYELILSIDPVNIKILPRPSELNVYDENMQRVYEYLELPWKPEVTLYVEYLDTTYEEYEPITGGSVTWEIVDPTTGEAVLSGNATLQGAYYVANINTSLLPEGNYKLRFVAIANNTEQAVLEISFVLRLHRIKADATRKQITVYHDGLVEVLVTYYDTDFEQYISGAKATFTIQSIAREGYAISGELLDLGNGTYLLRFNASELKYLGGYVIFVTLSKKHYETATLVLSLQVEEIPTYLYVSPSKNVSVLWGQNVTFYINYRDFRTGESIEGADFRVLVKDARGNLLTLPKLALMKGYENGYYYITIDTKYLNASEPYLIELFLGKAYYENQTETLYVIPEKLKLRIKVTTDTEVLKNPITGAAESEVQILIENAKTAAPVQGAKVKVIVELAGEVYAEVYATEKYPGVYFAKIDWKNAEPDRMYTIKVVIEEVNLPGMPTIPAKWIEYSEEEATIERVHVDYLGGTMAIGGFRGPRIILLPSFILVFVLGGFFGYKIYSWYMLPIEVRELITLMKKIEKGIYEYTAPARSDVFMEMLLEALGTKS